MAARWMGWKTVGWCEWELFCQEVLKKNFPEVIEENQHGDITKTNFTKYRATVDILTGGFPCQPYSSAGKRKGTADPRHLWPEMLRAIREVQPRYVVGENVRGLINWNGGLVFDQVQANLETEGYEVLPFLLPACGVNAPHRRDRIWFVAHAIGDGYGNKFGKGGRKTKEEQGTEQWQERAQIFRQWDGDNFERVEIEGATTNTQGSRDRGELRGLEGANGGKRKPEERGQNHSELGYNGHEWDATNSNSQSGQGGMYTERPETSERYIGPYNTPSHERGNWQNFPTVSPVRFRNDGLPSRMVRSAIKAGGNAIVPQVAFQIFKAIEQTDFFKLNTR